MDSHGRWLQAKQLTIYEGDPLTHGFVYSICINDPVVDPFRSMINVEFRMSIEAWLTMKKV